VKKTKKKTLAYTMILQQSGKPETKSFVAGKQLSKITRSLAQNQSEITSSNQKL